jgi:hypothetical protein
MVYYSHKTGALSGCNTKAPFGSARTVSDGRAAAQRGSALPQHSHEP